MAGDDSTTKLLFDLKKSLDQVVQSVKRLDMTERDDTTQTRAERGAAMMLELFPDRIFAIIPTSCSDSAPVVATDDAGIMREQTSEVSFNGLLQPVLEGLVAGVFRRFFLFAI
jgi:hypothetical protein